MQAVPSGPGWPSLPPDEEDGAQRREQRPAGSGNRHRVTGVPARGTAEEGRKRRGRRAMGVHRTLRFGGTAERIEEEDR